MCTNHTRRAFQNYSHHLPEWGWLALRVWFNFWHCIKWLFSFGKTILYSSNTIPPPLYFSLLRAHRMLLTRTVHTICSSLQLHLTALNCGTWDQAGNFIFWNNLIDVLCGMSYPDCQILSSNFLVMYCKISGVSRNMKAMLTEFILAEFLSVLVRGLLQRDQRTDL